MHRLILIVKCLSFRRKPESRRSSVLFWIPAFAGMTMIWYIFVPLYLNGAGSTAGETLIQSVSARAQGMADAATAIPADESGVLSYHYNPAAIGFSKRMETDFTFRRGLIEDNFAALTVGLPTRMGNVAGSFLYYSVGTIDLTTTAGTTRSVKALRDLAAVLSYSKLFWSHFSWGINGKFLRSELVESFTANAYALDMGFQIKVQNIVLGAAVQNGGTSLKYKKSSDPLPLTFRSGLSYRKTWSKDYKALAALDILKRQGDNPKSSLGFEYSLGSSALPKESELALRTGYAVGQDSGKISFGLGFKVGSYRMDYALQLMGGADNTHLVTLGLLFGSH